MRMSEVLIPAIRQYKHNDGSEGFVMAYDKTETDKAVNELNDENARLRKENEKLKGMIDDGLGWEDMKGGNRSDVE